MREKTRGHWQIDDKEYVSIQKVIDCPDTGRTELYNRAMGYFTDQFTDVDSVIQERDFVHGIIIAKGVLKKVHVQNSVLRNSSIDTWYILKVVVRDSRAFITLSLTHYDEAVRGSEPPDIHYLYPIPKQYPFNPAGYQKELYEEAFNMSKTKAAEIIASAEQALLAKGTKDKKDPL